MNFVILSLGAFLIPYFICVVTAGVPMALLETQLGQFMGQGGILCWKICPMFQGEFLETCTSL